MLVGVDKGVDVNANKIDNDDEKRDGYDCNHALAANIGSNNYKDNAIDNAIRNIHIRAMTIIVAITTMTTIKTITTQQ